MIARAHAAAAAVAFVALAPACSTQIGQGSVSTDRSTRIATSQPVLAIAVDDSSVYWLDSSEGVWSCPKTGCAEAPTAILAPARPSSTSASFSSNSPSEMAVVGGWVFWSDNGVLDGCPVAGCPAPGPTALTTGLSMVGTFSGFFAYDASGVYWASGSSVEQWTPGCSGASCPTNIFAGLGATASSTTTCFDVGCSCVTSACNGNLTCDPVTQTCVQCSAADPAPSCPFGQACNTTSQMCAACDGDWGSGTMAACPSASPVCSSGACVTCSSNATCSNGLACDSGFCGLPCASDGQCPQSQVCSNQATGLATGVCMLPLPNGASCDIQRPLLCAAGVCAQAPATPSGLCGYAQGQGACSTNPALCISGVCGSDGTCGRTNSEACTSASQCRSGVCSADGMCGLAPGAPCQSFSSTGAPGYTLCRAGSCPNATCECANVTQGENQNCGGFPAINLPTTASLTFAVASGRIFFTDGDGAIDACPISGCTLATVTTVRAGSGTPLSPPPSIPTILGATGSTVFFSAEAGLERCDWPSCTGSETRLGPALSIGNVGGNSSEPPPMKFTSATFWVPLSSVPNGGGIGGSVAYGQCSLTTCPASGPSSLSPDPAVDSRELGVGPYQGTLPFAVDDAVIYWASYGLYGLPGSQVLETPLAGP